MIEDVREVLRWLQLSGTSPAFPVFLALFLWRGRRSSLSLFRVLEGSPRTARAFLLVSWIAGTGLVASTYLTLNVVSDHVEAAVASISRLFLAGWPIFQDLDSSSRYTLPYGPLNFLASAGAMAAGSLSLVWAKLPTCLALVLTPPACWFGYQRRLPPKLAVLTAALVTIVALSFRNSAYWIRPDPLLLLLASLALIGGRHRSSKVACAGVGLAWGLSFAGKIHGPILLLPIVAEYWEQERLSGRGRLSLAILAISAGVGALILFALPGVSLLGHVRWLQMIRLHGLTSAYLLENSLWIAMLAFPVLASLKGQPGRIAVRRRPLFFGALAVASIGGGLLGAKPGAGFHHLLPLVPSFGLAWGLLLAEMPEERKWGPRPALAALMVALGLKALLTHSFLIQRYWNERKLGIAEEVLAIHANHPNGSLAMGYGSGSELLANYRWAILLNSGTPPPIYLEEVSMGDTGFSGLWLAEGTFQALEQCQVRYWLTPKGEAPFGGINPYDERPLFEPKFQQAFQARYRLTETTLRFSVWECR